MAAVAGKKAAAESPTAAGFPRIFDIAVTRASHARGSEDADFTRPTAWAILPALVLRGGGERRRRAEAARLPSLR